jgi:hypothetical protein
MVEGFGTTFLDDQPQHPFKILQNIAGSYAQRSDTCLRKPAVAVQVSRWRVVEVRHGPIHLNA